MKKTIKGILLLGCIWVVSGCATTHSPIYYSEKSNSSSGILLKCTTQIGQTHIIEHSIKIDNDDVPIIVKPMSEITIYLTPGWHTLEISSSASLNKSSPLGSYSRPAHKDVIFDFGKPTVEKIYINENEIKHLIYKTPFFPNNVGSLKNKE